MASGQSGGGVSSFEPFENILKAERVEKNLIANMPVSYTFLEHEHSIYEILVTAKENENYIALRCEVLKGTSKLVTAEPPGIVYVNENIWLGTQRVKEGLIKYKVENSWLDENNIASDNIKMLRYDGGQWIQLDTTEKTKDSNYTYYEAITLEFSPFAITGFEEEPITPAATITQPTPTVTEVTPEVKPPINWAIIIGVMFVIGLVVVVYLVRKGISK